MVKPTIHLNGDRPETLRENYVAAYHAVEAAITAVSATHPDGRNFYPQGDAVLSQARREHEARMAALRNLSAEMMELATHCDGFCK